MISASESPQQQITGWTTKASVETANIFSLTTVLCQFNNEQTTGSKSQQPQSRVNNKRSMGIQMSQFVVTSHNLHTICKICYSFVVLAAAVELLLSCQEMLSLHCVYPALGQINLLLFLLAYSRRWCQPRDTIHLLHASPSGLDLLALLGGEGGDGLPCVY